MSSENSWLEGETSLWDGPFLGDMLNFRGVFFPITLPKFHSSPPLKNYWAPKGKDFFQPSIFQGRTVEFHGCRYVIPKRSKGWLLTESVELVAFFLKKGIKHYPVPIIPWRSYSPLPLNLERKQDPNKSKPNHHRFLRTYLSGKNIFEQKTNHGGFFSDDASHKMTTALDLGELE